MAPTPNKVDKIQNKLNKMDSLQSKVVPVKIDSNMEDNLENNNPPYEIVWRNVVLMIYLHVSALYGLFLLMTGQIMFFSFLFSFFFTMATGFGVTAGAHRYWAHKSFKATTPLRIIMAILQTSSCQNSIHEWCRDHRVHHKFTETNADPHNAKRGFFFAHVGWLLTKKHKDVKEKGKTIDLSDLEADPIVMFQKKYFLILTILITFAIPTVIPWFFWGENLATSYLVTLLRYSIALHATWAVNSAAHLWGKRPYDGSINPAENAWVTFFASGEGWHNYHHVFPWDYRTGEVGPYKLNFTASNINRFARIGWAYDLKTVPEHIVRQRVGRTGDGSHETFPSEGDHSQIPHEHEPGPWGWGDPSIPVDSVNVTKTLYKKRG